MSVGREFIQLRKPWYKSDLNTFETRYKWLFYFKTTTWHLRFLFHKLKNWKVPSKMRDKKTQNQIYNCRYRLLTFGVSTTVQYCYHPICIYVEKNTVKIKTSTRTISKCFQLYVMLYKYKCLFWKQAVKMLDKQRLLYVMLV